MNETIGIIVRVTGHVELSNHVTSKQVLTSATGTYVVIHKLDRLFVKSGVVTLSMADGSTSSLKPAIQPYILNGKGIPSITDQFRRGGLSRGSNDGRIVYPMTNERLTLDAFTVRWNLQPLLKSFILVKVGKVEGIDVTADKLKQTSISESDLSTLLQYIKDNGYGRYQLAGKAGDTFQSVDFEVVSDNELVTLNTKLTKFSNTSVDGLVMRAHICAAQRFFLLAQNYLKSASDLSPDSKPISSMFLEVSKLCGEDTMVRLAESRYKRH